jgi:hypothetical protein
MNTVRKNFLKSIGCAELKFTKRVFLEYLENADTYILKDGVCIVSDSIRKHGYSYKVMFDDNAIEQRLFNYYTGQENIISEELCELVKKKLIKQELRK